jgi:uncharacterized iron-regulated membrane protein
MRLSILSRKLHRWGAIAIGLPVLSVIGSGILLQVKKQVPWVQPHEERTEHSTPSVDWGLMLAAARGVPEAGVTGWDDIDRVDVRPGKGILKVVTKSRWEVQMALATGEVLQVAYRRSDLIESLHDGSFYGDRTKLAIFLPSGLVLFGLWLTGLYLWLLPYLTKRKRAKLQEEGSPAPGARA